MKKIAMLLFGLLIILSACGNTTPNVDDDSTNAGNGVVKNREITLNLSFGARTGKYSGTLNAEGLPEGTGTFTTTNSAGDSWTYTGEFVNGHFDGMGETKWSTSRERGMYKDDILQPIDSSLVSNVYLSPSDYEDCLIETYGKVFNIVDANDGTTFQMYQDIINSDNNTIVITADANIHEADLVKVTALVRGVEEYENAFGGKMEALLLVAKSVEKASYIEALSPTLKSVEVNETKTQYGYSVTIQKVEFAEEETRVYIKVENNGANKFNVYEWNAVVVQNSQQYSYQSNWEADYPELQTDLRPGTITEGIIAFPALSQEDLTIYLDGSSEDWHEEIEEMEFVVAVN